MNTPDHPDHPNSSPIEGAGAIPSPFVYPRLKLGSIRRRYGVSIKTILREVGISEQTYYLIERGASNPKFATLCYLCRFFQLSLDDLFGDLAEQIAPGYNEAVARGRAGEDLVVPPAPKLHHSDDYNLVPVKPLLNPRLLSRPPVASPITPSSVPLAPSAPQVPSELLPPPPPEFLKALVEEFSEKEFFDPFGPEPDQELQPQEPNQEPAQQPAQEES